MAYLLHLLMTLAVDLPSKAVPLLLHLPGQEESAGAKAQIFCCA
jgi:hypothetical protein